MVESWWQSWQPLQSDSSNVPATTSFGVDEIKEDCVAEIVLCFADYGNQYRRSSKQPAPTSFPTWC